jgi:hypothetical protein
MTISDQGRILFKDAMVNFRANPEMHVQSTWICRTGCCLAGGVVLTAGAVPLFNPANWNPDRTLTVEYEGRVRSIPDLANTLLGVSMLDAVCLFMATNTIDDLEAMYGILDGGDHLREECIRCGEQRSTKALDKALPDYEFNECECDADNV